MTDIAIKIEHLNYVYSPGTAYEKHALKDICMEIPHGEFVGIIGHTGSGKSTLIQHLNGLVKATDGAIYYNGENIYQNGCAGFVTRSDWCSSIRSISFLRLMY